MSDNSAIEWTDATWNPIRARYTEIAPNGSFKDRVGWHCAHVSEGCRFCYAEAFNRRLGTGLDYKPANLAPSPAPGAIGRAPGATIFLDEKVLTQPLRWKKPRKIFVGSMTDLFADFVTDEMLDLIFAVMAASPHHTYQIPTKRPKRMLEYLTGENPFWRLHHEAAADVSSRLADLFKTWFNVYSLYLEVFAKLPLRNVWLGVSIEDQVTADQRVPFLLKTPAALRFVSAEPLLGPISLRCIPWTSDRGFVDATTGKTQHEETRARYPDRYPDTAKIDWVIAGGESGAGARPMHPYWALLLRDQCTLSKIPFFFKQWGEWREWEHGPQTDKIEANTAYSRSIAALAHNAGWVSPTGEFLLNERSMKPGIPYRLMERLGKKATGAMLHGREHREFPSTP